MTTDFIIYPNCPTRSHSTLHNLSSRYSTVK